MTKYIASTLFLATLGIATAGSAQHVTQLPARTTHAVGIEGGLDSAMVFSAGYSYRLRPAVWQYDVLFQGSVTVPFAGFDPSDSRLQVGLRTTAIAYGDLRLQVGLGLHTHSTSNVAFSARGIGAHFTLLPGYQSERWGLMAELGYERIIASYVSASERYKRLGYAEAQEGWYGSTGGNIRLGLRGGARVGPVELSARLGIQASEGGNPGFPPLYATVGIAYAF